MTKEYTDCVRSMEHLVRFCSKCRRTGCESCDYVKCLRYVVRRNKLCISFFSLMDMFFFHLGAVFVFHKFSSVLQWFFIAYHKIAIVFQRSASDFHWLSYVVCRPVAEASCLVEEEHACGGDWHCEVPEENLRGSL